MEGSCGPAGRFGLCLVYHDDYDLHLGAHIFPSQKYRLVRQALLESGRAVAEDFLTPEPASDEDVLRVHTREYVRKLKTGRLSPLELLRLEIPYSPELVRAVWLAAGGSILAARCGTGWRPTSAAASTTPSPITARVSACCTTWPSPSGGCRPTERSKLPWSSTPTCTRATARRPFLRATGPSLRFPSIRRTTTPTRSRPPVWTLDCPMAPATPTIWRRSKAVCGAHSHRSTPT